MNSILIWDYCKGCCKHPIKYTKFIHWKYFKCHKLIRPWMRWEIERETKIELIRNPKITRMFSCNIFITDKEK